MGGHRPDGRHALRPSGSAAAPLVRVGCVWAPAGRNTCPHWPLPAKWQHGSAPTHSSIWREGTAADSDRAPTAHEGGRCPETKQAGAFERHGRQEVPALSERRETVGFATVAKAAFIAQLLRARLRTAKLVAMEMWSRLSRRPLYTMMVVEAPLHAWFLCFLAFLCVCMFICAGARAGLGHHVHILNACPAMSGCIFGRPGPCRRDSNCHQLIRTFSLCIAGVVYNVERRKRSAWDGQSAVYRSVDEAFANPQKVCAHARLAASFLAEIGAGASILFDTRVGPCNYFVGRRGGSPSRLRAPTVHPDFESILLFGEARAASVMPSALPARKLARPDVLRVAPRRYLGVRLRAVCSLSPLQGYEPGSNDQRIA